jgi:hypothetical protein
VVTSLVALLPPERLGAGVHAQTIAWLMATQGQESAASYRFREWLLGNATSPEQEFAGWPWIPGAAAWVGPTSLAIMALDKEQRRKPTVAIGARLEEGRRFLLRRMCHEGGWNHGSVRALGYESHPYPETTGMALAALRGVRAPQLDSAVSVAAFTGGRSADAELAAAGASAHGQLPPGFRGGAGRVPAPPDVSGSAGGQAQESLAS